MTPVKKTTKIVEEAVKAAEAVKTVEAVKAVEKAVEAKEQKKAAVKKEAAPKKAPAKKEAAPKKTAAKKEAAPEASVMIEFAGKQFAAKKILDKATKAYKAAHKGAAIKTIEIYVKPEESVAYYVVNGEGSDDFKINL